MRRPFSRESAVTKARNSAALRESIARRATYLDGLPEVVALHTTERCNLRCVMCERSLRQGVLQLARERLARVCDELFPTAYKVALSGAKGEPLLADFDLVAARAIEHDVRIDLVTNGTELDAELYGSIAGCLDHLNVSIDSPDPATYERIRRGSRFDRLMENLSAIRGHRRRHPDDVLISLSAVVMNSTLPHIEELLRLAALLEFDGVILQPLSHAGKDNANEDPAAVLGHSQLHERLEAMRPLARRHSVHLFFANFALHPEIVRPLRAKVPDELPYSSACTYVLQHFGVQPDGRVFPCYLPTDLVLGDTNTQSAAAIWNGAPFQELRRAHYEKLGTLFCSGCVHAPGLPAREPSWLQEQQRAERLARVDAERERMRLGFGRPPRDVGGGSP